MKLATLRNGQRDGRLVVVSDDARRCIDACPVAPTLLDALERWSVVEPALHDLARTVNAPAALGAMPFDARQCLAPLPRTWQWLDGSAFLNHGQAIALLVLITTQSDQNRNIETHDNTEHYRTVMNSAARDGGRLDDAYPFFAPKPKS